MRTSVKRFLLGIVMVVASIFMSAVVGVVLTAIVYQLTSFSDEKSFITLIISVVLTLALMLGYVLPKTINTFYPKNKE